MHSTILFFHIVAGTLGMLSGFVAVFLRKGSRRHRRAGIVFVIAMLSLSASGTYLAILKHQPGNVLGGMLTFYLTFGVEAAMSPSGMKYDYPPWPYFIFGLVAVLATVGDIRMLVRGGISGTQRLARHLWRMCFALFIAASSIFLARQHLFPAIFRRTGVLFVLSFLPLLLMIFWLVRVRFARAYRKTDPAFRVGPVAGRVVTTNRDALKTA